MGIPKPCFREVAQLAIIRMTRSPAISANTLAYNDKEPIFSSEGGQKKQNRFAKTELEHQTAELQ